MSKQVEQVILEILKRHEDSTFVIESDGTWLCNCGQKLPTVAGNSLSDMAQLHLAQVLVAALGGQWVSRDEVLEEVAKWLEFNDGHADQYAHIAEYIRALKGPREASPIPKEVEP